MFHIKICGITNVDDAVMVAQSGAEAVGLNFCKDSPRSISQQQARQIVEALPPGVVKVGVFVEQSAEQTCRIFDELGLDLIQLHGRQPLELIRSLGQRPVMPVFHVTPAGLDPLRQLLDQCRAAGCRVPTVMIDAQAGAVRGGTGRLADWPAAARYLDLDEYPPLVLAGGLRPLNVAEAIMAVRPAAVDAASGIELARGRKDPALVAAFVDAARRAFATIRG